MLPTRRGQNWLPDIFNDFFDNQWMGRPNATAPAINIIESDKEYKVEVAAPGMTKNDFDIRINEENQLVVSMEKKEEHREKAPETDDKEGKGAPKQERYLRREFSYSRFQQAMILPDDIEKDKISAKMENGVLHIVIPKSQAQLEARRERLIEIK